MERARWTDERLDKQMTYINRNFDRVFGDLHAGRAEMRADMAALRGEVKSEVSALRGEFKSEMTTLREEMRTDFAAVRGDLTAHQRQMATILALFAVGLLGILAGGQL